MATELETIGLGMETSGVERGIRSLDELAARGPKVEQAMKGVESAAKQAGQGVGALGQGNASAGVEKVGAAGERAAQGLGKMGQAAQSAVSSQAALARAVDGFTQAEQKYIQSLLDEYKALDQTRGAKAAYIAQQRGMSQSAQEVARAIGGKIDALKAERAELEKNERASQAAAASAMGLAKSLIGAVAGGALAREYIQSADAITTLNNQLKLATGSADAAKQAYGSLYEIAQRSRVSFTELGTTYASIARATGEMGISQQRLLKVTESIGNAMTISGGSAQGMQAALVQLGQGFASGTLRGEELNSVMEQTPRLAKAIADGLGISTGKLREMGAAGQLTSEAVVKALESQSEALKKEVAGSTLTVGQAFTQLSNASTKAIGDFDQASGASASLAQAISSIATSMDGMGDAFKRNEGTIQTVMGALTGAAALATLAAIPRAIAAIGGAVTGLSAVLAANPVVLTLLGIGAAAGGVVAGLNAYSKTASGIEGAIERLKGENERSEAALQRAMAGGRTAGADNIRRTIEERRKAISELNDELLKLQATEVKGAGGGRGTMNPPTVAAMNFQQEKTDEALAEARRKLLGINKEYLPNLKNLNDLYVSGAMSLAEYREHVSKLAEDTYNASTAGKAAAKTSSESAAAAKAEQSAYDKLIASIQTKLAQNEAEIAGGAKLTDAEKLRIQLTKELEQGSRKMTAARVAEAQAQLALLDASERSLAVHRAQQKFEQERDKAIQAASGEIAKINEKAQALEDEAAAYGKTESELLALTIARLEDKKATVTEYDPKAAEEEIVKINERIAALTRLGVARDAMLDLKLGSRVDEIVRAAEAEAAAYQDELRLAGLTAVERAKIVAERKIELEYAKEIAKVDASGASDAAKEREKARLRAAERKAKETAGAEAVSDEWQKTADQINQSLTDALMRGFENGKDFAANLRDTVVNMFKTMVLRPIISAIVMPVTGAIADALGFSGSAIAGQGGMGGMGGMGGIGLLGSLATSPWGASALGWAGGMGGFGAGFAGAASEAALGSAFVGPSVSAAGGSIGAGATFAQALPYLGLALGAIALLSGFDKSGTPHYGASATYDGGKVSGDEAAFLANRGISGRYSASAQSGVNAVAMGAGMSLDAMDRAFGGKGGYAVTTAYSDDSSDDPGFGSLRITRNGEKVVDWGDTRTSKWADKIFADGAEGAKMYADAVATDVRDAMLDIDLPSWARDLLTEIGDNVSMEQLGQVVQQIGVIKDTFDALGSTLTGFADLTDEARKRILDASGSIDALAANAGTFYQNFYTEGERTDIAKKQVRAQLDALGVDINLDDPEARAKYRALVESQLANIDKEGAPELYAALLKLSGAFAAVTTSADDAAEAAKRQAEQDRRSAYDALRRAIDRDRKDLQAQASSLGEAINGISSAVDLLKSNARELYDEVDSTAQMAAARGMVYVENALAGVRAGASVADYTGLSDAISAARGGLGSGAYQSEFERQRDTLVLAGQLSELGDLGDAQLSVEERQLRVINEQIEWLDKLAQQADELVNGTAALTGTVDSHFAQLIALLTPDKGDGGGAGGSGDGGGKFGIGGSGPGESAGGVGGAGETTDEEIRRYFKDTDISDAQSMRNARNTALFMGWTQEDIAKAYDVDPADLRKLFDDFGIPSFDVGINRVPHDMVARIHKDEAILPAAYNPFNPGAQRFGGGDSALVEELRALRKEVAELRLISAVTASNTSQLPVMADQFDSVTEGGNAMRGDAANVLEL